MKERFDGWMRRLARGGWVRYWLPQGLRDRLNRWFGYAIVYRGQFRDWASACAAARGYAETQLAERIESAALAVQRGEAVWEKDGVTYDYLPPAHALWASLARVALARGDGRLVVLDFGGAYGSSFRQCRAFLSDLAELRWLIVEQKHVVERGQAAHAGGGLEFYPDINVAVSTEPPDVVLFSAVLQYLEDPWQWLDACVRHDVDFILIDRLPCSVGAGALTVQVVPESLYAASYPSWLFEADRLIEHLKPDYELLDHFDGVDPPISGNGLKAVFRGFLFRRRRTA